MTNLFKCPLCKLKYTVKTSLYAHIENDHPEELEKVSAAQLYFNFRNRYPLTKTHGLSVISGKPTKFNNTTERYERLLPEEKELYRNIVKKRMVKKYGKEHLLDDPEHQKQMLANRKISGEYKWKDGTITSYTGSYEKDFLVFLENVLDWDSPSDIFAPAPMIFEYDWDGKKKFHIPDFYIQSLNLVVQIKASDNKHYRARDLEKELLLDSIIKKSKYNYIKVYDKKYSNFVKYIEKEKNKL